MSDLVASIQRRLEREPDAVVVADRARAITARELRERTRCLEKALLDHGVNRGSTVGIQLPSSPEYIAAIIACLNLGARFVPLDPNHPATRLQQIIAAADVDLVLITAADKSDTNGAPTLALSWDSLERESDSTSNAAKESDIAYVLFTSGSTGTPKGVPITHGALHNHMQWMSREFPLAPDDVVLQKTPTTFDASVWEIFAPLVDGGILRIGAGLHQQPEALVETVKAHQVTVLQAVPTFYWALLDAGLSSCASLRRLFVGGEVLSAALVRALKAKRDIEVVNLYGPTEATIQTVFWRCKDDRDPVPIGLPVDNVLLKVHDENGRSVSPGTVGELHIGGVQVSPGYLNNPEQSASSFYVEEQSGTRWYRTGDLVWQGDDKELYFKGRKDRQVKFRGYRIELGEIENAALRLEGVHSAAVDVRIDDGAERLVLYYSGDGDIDHQRVREHIATLLPAYMVPNEMQRLREIPLLPSGKLDRNSLSSALTDKSSAAQLENDDQREIAAQWRQLTGASDVGADSNFIELGGDSLLMMQFIAWAEKSRGVRLDAELVMLRELRDIAEEFSKQAAPMAEKRKRQAKSWRERRKK